MKSEERHELKVNELERLTTRVRPILEQYGMHIALGASAVILIAAAALFWSRMSAAGQTAGWAEYLDATASNSTAKLVDVAEAEDAAKNQVAIWARLRAAEGYLESGIQQSIEGRDEGQRGLVSDLDEARKNFQAVLEKAPAKSELQERALFGLGRCLETMAGVNQRTDAKNSTTTDLLTEAAEAYDKLLKDFPNSPYNQKRYEDEELGKLERHLKFLKSQEAAEFYAWFRTQKPVKKDRRGPFDSLPGGHPPLDTGPVILPSIPDSLKLSDEEPAAGPAFPGASSEPDKPETDGAEPAKPPADPAPADGDKKSDSQPETNDEP